MDRQEQLDRIEAGIAQVNAKLDMLIDALAEEGEDTEQQFDLDGNALPAGGEEGEAL